MRQSDTSQSRTRKCAAYKFRSIGSRAAQFSGQCTERNPSSGRCLPGPSFGGSKFSGLVQLQKWVSFSNPSSDSWNASNVTALIEADDTDFEQCPKPLEQLYELFPVWSLGAEMYLNEFRQRQPGRVGQSDGRI